MTDYTIEFQEPEHIYTVTIDGIIKNPPSVTDILASEGLTKYWNDDEWYLERGDIIHQCTAMIDRDTLDWASVDERIKGYLEAYMSFREQSKWVFEHIEKALYHPIYGYCGMFDRFPPLLDIKCGQGFPLQLTAYAELLKANGYNPGLEGYFLNLLATGKYNLKPYKFSRTDRNIWLSAVSIYNYKRRNGNNTRLPDK